MRDLVFVAVSVLFFVLGVVYIAACLALNPGDRR